MATSRKTALATAIGDRPLDAILLVFWVVQIGLSLWILSPFFVPENAPALMGGLGSLIAIKIYGLLMGVPAAIGLVAMAKNWPRRKKIMDYVVTASFFIFLYFTVLRILLFGPENIVWVSYFLNTAVMAIAHYRLKWERAG